MILAEDIGWTVGFSSADRALSKRLGLLGLVSFCVVCPRSVISIVVEFVDLTSLLDVFSRLQQPRLQQQHQISTQMTMKITSTPMAMPTTIKSTWSGTEAIIVPAFVVSPPVFAVGWVLASVVVPAVVVPDVVVPVVVVPAVASSFASVTGTMDAKNVTQRIRVNFIAALYKSAVTTR